MKAIIMAGGFGTRLRPLTVNIPKPMVPMANKPMMEHIVRLLKANGFTDLVVMLYYQPEVIIHHFGDGTLMTRRRLNGSAPLIRYWSHGAIRALRPFQFEDPQRLGDALPLHGSPPKGIADEH